MVAGDNMTGDLTLGTDKITLDATDGSVIGTGIVGTTVPSADFGLFVNNSDSSTTSFVVQGQGTTSIGPGSAGGAYGITLNPRSGATPAYIALNDTEAAGAPNLSLGAGGDAYYYDGSAMSWRIFPNGSATFNSGKIQLTTAGAVDATSTSYSFIGRAVDGTANFAVDNTGLVNIGPISGTVSNIVLDGTDGSATFAGNVVSGNDPWATAAAGVAIDKTGTVSVGNGGGVVWYGKDTSSGTSVVTSRINADGSATFQNTLTVGNSGAAIAQGLSGVINNPANAYSAAIVGTNYTAGGRVWLGQNSTANATSQILENGSATFATEVVAGVRDVNGVLMTSAGTTQGVSGGVSRYALSGADGSATFSGLIKTGVSNTNQGTGSWIQPDGGVYTTRPSGSSAALFAGYQQGETTPRVELSADGSAAFSSHVDTNSFFWSKNTDSLNGGCYLYNFDGNASRNNGALYISPTASSSNTTIQLDYNGTASFAGTINGATVGTSDARFKENITPAKPQLADVVALGGLLKNYDWNEDAPVNEEIRSQRQLGLIAQEVEVICPSLTKSIARTQTLEVTPAVMSDEGEVLTEAVTQEIDDSYKGISTDALIMKLLGAVTELSVKVEALESKE